MTPFQPSRRELIQQMACGVGGLGLAALLADEARADAPGAPGPHHPAKAKSLIFLNMQGGPTQFETFDYKPEMAKWDGKAPPDITGRQEGTVRFNPGSTITAPLFKYVRSKMSAVATTEIFPHMAKVLDELCVIRSMRSDSPAHPGGQTQALTGYTRQGMPSIGAWFLYGLGSANKNLPGYVYLAEGHNHHSGFLPAECQGMPVGNKVPNLRRPAVETDAKQRVLLDELASLNRGFAERHPGESALNARVEAAELAFRMQMACPEAVDLSKESRATLDLYGIGGGKPAGKPASRSLSYTTEEFSTMCLTARRLVERGVRVVTICVGGRRGWDQHSVLKASVEHNAKVIDQGMAALLTDLKRTGLLDSTVVMWGGEFGRTPYAQGKDGRDHFAKGYTYWLAGGGAKRGVYYGETDEAGMTITKDPVHIHDLHATVMQLMGLDHKKLTYRYAGRDHTLTDIHGQVVPGLIG
ncbi:MAG: DUF1501 domain-containing protein [Isosphaera sp.]|nr:DUF1501 domain-containing protein [Isosphaera sp.]